jgi:hypothetical protein
MRQHASPHKGLFLAIGFWRKSGNLARSLRLFRQLAIFRQKKKKKKNPEGLLCVS